MSSTMDRPIRMRIAASLLGIPEPQTRDPHDVELDYLRRAFQKLSSSDEEALTRMREQRSLWWQMATALAAEDEDRVLELGTAATRALAMLRAKVMAMDSHELRPLLLDLVRGHSRVVDLLRYWATSPDDEYDDTMFQFALFEASDVLLRAEDAYLHAWLSKLQPADRHFIVDSLSDGLESRLHEAGY